MRRERINSNDDIDKKMIASRCPLVICFGLLGLVSTMLATHVDAFALTTNHYRSNRMAGSSWKANANICSLFFSRRKFCRRYQTPASAVNTGDDSSAATTAADAASTPMGPVGLYKQYAEYAVGQLLGTGWLEEDTSIPDGLSANRAPARGTKTESIVRITTRVLVPKPPEPTDEGNNNNNNNSNSLIRYARIALLETVPLESPDGDETEIVASDGIQVLNFVVLPGADTTLPVLGIDLVSLPGSKHLLLLDAQPMVQPNPHEGHWEGWYNRHVRDDDDNNNSGDNDESGPQLKYAWGGDFPEAVQKYVSRYALWTRLQNLPERAEDDSSVKTSPAVGAIRGELFDAFREHLDAYLELVGNFANDVESVKGENNQPSYLDYRRNNDPAKPMLNSLYGAEWTQSLLDDVLFPKD